MNPRFLTRVLLVPSALIYSVATASIRAEVLHVLQQSISFIDEGAPSTFFVNFTAPLVGITGPVQVTTSIIGVYGDGERNGASVGLNSPTLLSGSLNEVNLTKHTSIGTGGAASFAGAGGAVGKVLLFGSSGTDFGAPSTFFLDGTKAFDPSTERSTSSQMHLGGALMDFSGDGAAMTGLFANTTIAEFLVDNTAHTHLGPSFSAVGLTGTLLDSGTASVAGLQINNEIKLQFGISGNGDSFALMGRQEIGGDALIGTVLQLYPLSTSTEVVDAGAVGAFFAEVNFSMLGSGGGDSYAFIMRQEISTVPECGQLAGIIGGLLGIVAIRRVSSKRL